MNTLERIGKVEAQLEDIGNQVNEGRTGKEMADVVKRYHIMCSVIRGLHDYSIKYAPNINYYDGKRLIYDGKRIK